MAEIWVAVGQFDDLFREFFHRVFGLLRRDGVEGQAQMLPTGMLPKPNAPCPRRPSTDTSTLIKVDRSLIRPPNFRGVR